MNWITANLGTIVCSLVLILMVGLALKSVISERKNGSCKCGCSGCPGCNGCCPHSRKEERKDETK
ncbi:MAG: FeoB-associated Cys-rich membrane protein [Lachnospiraceae bacterium]|nr:FeoB-associated Cys-rich membrane protein [Lachnospiraceae bacterium]